MQDIHSLVGGRIFGAATSGDRRLRPLQHHHHSNHHHHQQQALKCPRCDSFNTKFCYYNNYNLSQPRHFCKSCRRYWTKGGVLRNVPVGGGCRKNKRSKPKNNNPSTNQALSAGEPPQTAPQPPPPQATEKPPYLAEPKSSPPSSSESSSVTGTEAVTAAAAVSAPAPTSVSASEILGMSEFRSVVPASGDPSACGPVFEHALLEQLGTAGDNSVIFTENDGNGGGGGGFTGLMMTSWNEPFSASSNAILLNSHQQSQWFHEDKLQGISGGFLDQTVENRSREGNSGFGALDWQPSGGDNDQALFDLPNTVDQAYWSHTQWTDQDNTNLYLP